MSQQHTPITKLEKLDSKSLISDTQATNPKQLLNAYVYDFLVKSRLPQTAKIFVNEADIPSITESPSNDSITSPNTTQYHKDNDLPLLKVSMNAPQGFLFEWWLVFWDVYQAKNTNGNSSMASQYYQLQLLKQRQQQDLQGFNGANFLMQQQPQFQQMAGKMAQGQPQSAEQQRAMMQFMMDKQNVPLQQQMFMQQNGPQNRIQQHAQSQMNNLRQQAAVAAQRPGDHSSPQPRPGMTPQQQATLSAAQRQNHGSFGQINGMQYSPQMMSGNTPGGPHPPPSESHPQPQQQSQPNDNFKGPPNNSSNNRNINALQDYQMQLMLLEKQNKKRLDIARNSGSSDPNTLATLTAGMLPPNQQQVQQLQMLQQSQQAQQQNQQNQPPQNPIRTPTSNPSKPSPATMTGPSPVIGNKPSPGGTKKRKESTAKRGRKPSVSSQNNTTPSNSATTPSHLKKGFSTPLTPTSETPNDTTGAANKRKRKGSGVNESPKKLAANKATIKKESDVIEEEKEEKKQDDLDAMVAPDVASNFQEIGQDQLFSMQTLDSGNGDGHLFGNGLNSNGLDEIDFDFNLFLDGNVNDGINTFNWGGVDAIESGDS